MILRPEGTAPVCRAYLEHGMHNLPQPVLEGVHLLFDNVGAFTYRPDEQPRVLEHWAVDAPVPVVTG